MEFKRRLQLYMIGLGGGILLSFGIFGKGCTNTAWMPEARVRLRMHNTLVHATSRAQQQLDAMNIGLADLCAAMDSASVNFKESRRTSDSLYYAMATTLDGRPLTFSVAALRDYMIDSTATLLEIAPKTITPPAAP